jgi:hypothetical protein
MTPRHVLRIIGHTVGSGEQLHQIIVRETLIKIPRPPSKSGVPTLKTAQNPRFVNPGSFRKPRTIPGSYRSYNQV